MFSNYRLVQGVNTPYSTVRLQNGEMRNQRFINNVTYNSELSPDSFRDQGSDLQSAKVGWNSAVANLVQVIRDIPVPTIEWWSPFHQIANQS